MIRTVVNLFISFSSQHLFLPRSAQPVLSGTVNQASSVKEWRQAPGWPIGVPKAT